MLETRFGNLVTHPLLKKYEQRFYRLYVEGMKLLESEILRSAHGTPYYRSGRPPAGHVQTL